MCTRSIISLMFRLCSNSVCAVIHVNFLVEHFLLINQHLALILKCASYTVLSVFLQD